MVVGFSRARQLLEFQVIEAQRTRTRSTRVFECVCVCTLAKQKTPSRVQMCAELDLPLADVVCFLANTGWCLLVVGKIRASKVALCGTMFRKVVNRLLQRNRFVGTKSVDLTRQICELRVMRSCTHDRFFSLQHGIGPRHVTQRL